jgi:hypothetical protein
MQIYKEQYLEKIINVGYEILSDRIMNEHSITKAVLFFNALF